MKFRLKGIFLMILHAIPLGLGNNRFVKHLALDDPDVGRLIKELDDPAPRPAKSLMACVASAQKQLYYRRCSAFKFVDGNCTLAQTPPFIDDIVDKEPLSSRQEGYYTLMSKPISRVVHSDLFVYILINEEEDFNAHPNLPFPPDSKVYNGDTMKYRFDRESAVKTLEGKFAGTPVNGAFLELGTPESHKGLTMSAWYHPGGTWTSNLESLTNIWGSGTFFTLHIGPLGTIHITYDVNGEIKDISTRSGVIDPTAWHYITMAYDFITGAAAIYEDGVLVHDEVGHSFGRNLTFGMISVGNSVPGGLYHLLLTGYIASAEYYSGVQDAGQVYQAYLKSTSYRVGM